MIQEIDEAYKLNYEGFDYSKYFNSESDIRPVSSVVKYLKNKSLDPNYDFKLHDFVRWIKDGVWQEEDRKLNSQ